MQFCFVQMRITIRNATGVGLLPSVNLRTGDDRILDACSTEDLPDLAGDHPIVQFVESRIVDSEILTVDSTLPFGSPS